MGSKYKGPYHTTIMCDDYEKIALTYEKCNSLVGWEHPPKEPCDNGNLCTNDSHFLETGECVFTPIDCNDYSWCTTKFVILTLVVVHPPMYCDDGKF